ncbi:kinase-like domain-containing protein [Phanerochaete sordida]|uniref:Kinase-like domain-containing protein n=1 Tax=Phanerochaete sordida TaxID=48140 RepID=A0A9P3GD30_9APHY|nr:kinase-like domain-containing protein [Phanerochaete sordida]
MPSRTSPAPAASCITLRFIQLLGSLNKTGQYSLHIKSSNGRDHFASISPTSTDTATPNWSEQEVICLLVPIGTHTISLEVYREGSGLGASIPEQIGRVCVPLHELFTIPRPFRLSAPYNPTDTTSPGFISLQVVTLSNQQIQLDTLPKDLALRPPIRTLRNTLDALDFARLRFGNKAVAASLNAGHLLTQVVLRTLTDRPELISREVEAQDMNVVWDLSRHLEQHTTYFMHSFSTDPDVAPREKTSIVHELLFAVSEAMAIIFGFLHAYPNARYDWVRGASMAASTAALDLQYRMLVLDAKMRKIVPEKSASAPTPATFFVQLAGILADTYKESDAPSGPAIGILGCVRGMLARDMLDGYKAYMDSLNNCCDAKSRLLRRTARRLMAMLAKETGMLPSSLEIPSTLFGKKPPTPKRRVGTHGMEIGGGERARGSYGEVRFTTMKCVKRNTTIAVALKKITEATTPEQTKRTYLEILNGWTLYHPRLLATEGITHEGLGGERVIVLVSEKMGGGVLSKYISTSEAFERRTPQQKIRLLNLWLRQIAEGIKYMHDEGIVHGDLHAGNIFLNTNDGTDHNVVIADFGLSIYVDSASNQFQSMRSGAERFLPPERFIPDVTDKQRERREVVHGVPAHLISPSKRPTTQSDLFSWAMICIQLYTQERPFTDIEDGIVASEIIRGARPTPLPKAIAEQELLAARIKTCWKQNPEERETAGRLLDDMRRLASSDTP